MSSDGLAAQKEHNFELKYCEWCGGLWLRKASGTASLCPACTQLVTAFPRLWGAKLKRREAPEIDIKAGKATATSVTSTLVPLIGAQGECAC